MPELLLIAATPPADISASASEMPRAIPPAQPLRAAIGAPTTAAATATFAIDVEAIARDVYHHLLAQLDARRVRSGECTRGDP